MSETLRNIVKLSCWYPAWVDKPRRHFYRKCYNFPASIAHAPLGQWSLSALAELGRFRPTPH